MSDWIDDEAENIRREREATKDKEYLISMSNYWAVLRSQIEQDVSAINSNAEWHDLFREIVKIENIDFGGLRVKKSSYPGAFRIDLTNGGDVITLNGYYKLDNDHEYENFEVKFYVELERGHITLKDDKGETFIVPEQASQRILQVVLRAKNDSVKFFADRPWMNR